MTAAPRRALPILALDRPDNWRGESRALVALAGPLVGANVLQMAIYAIDVMFVARLGTVEFAASTLGVFLFSIIFWALMGLTTACAPIIAAELGARAHAVREVRRSFRMALWLSVIACVPFMLLLAFGETILLAAGQNPQVAARSGAFLDILLWALLPNVAAVVMRATAAALGRPNWAMIITAAALAVGLAGNWLLVFGNGGFPALGLEGSAIASLVTALFMCGAYGVVLITDPRLRRFRLFGRWWRSEWSRLAQITRLGVPIALSFTMEGALFGGAAILMGLISVEAVAAHAVALNIAALAFQVPLGVAQAVTIRVGMAYGAVDHGWIRRAGWTGIVVGTGFMVTTAVLIWATPLQLINIYIDTADPANAAVVPLAVQFLFLAAVFQLADGAQVVAAGALRGLQDTRTPMIIAGISYWIFGFGTAILLGFQHGWGGVGIWVGLLVGLIVASALLLWRWSMRGGLGVAAHSHAARREAIKRLRHKKGRPDPLIYSQVTPNALPLALASGEC